MVDTIKSIPLIKTLLEEVLVNLDSINQNDFDLQFNGARNKMLAAKKLKDEIIACGKKDEILRLNQILEPITKQITQAYDNKVEEFNLAANAVLKELFIIQNKKKLTIYSR